MLRLADVRVGRWTLPYRTVHDVHRCTESRRRGRRSVRALETRHKYIFLCFARHVCWVPKQAAVECLGRRETAFVVLMRLRIGR